MAKGQAERLVPLLQEVLAEAGAVWRDLAGIGVGIGPGNFTGIRIAVATARGLSLSLGVPAIGVSTLEAAAEGLAQPVLAAVDARRDEVYLQGFGCAPERPLLMGAEEAAAFALDASGAQPVAVTGSGAELLGVQSDAPALPLAEAIGRIAAARLAAGEATPRPAPLYLRSADAAPPADPPPVILP